MKHKIQFTALLVIFISSLNCAAQNKAVETTSLDELTAYAKKLAGQL